MKYLWMRPVLIIALVAMALTGCSNSDGDNGAPGAPGVDGQPAVVFGSNASAMNVVVEELNVSADNPAAAAAGSTSTSITFRVTNEDDVPVAGLKNFNFTLSGLEPEVGPEASHWVLLGSESCPESAYSSCAEIPPVDNGDGSYSYTFATDISNIDGYSYNANKTHRVMINLGGETLGDGVTPITNASYDFTAAAGATTDSRQIVATATCNVCHDSLSAHGGKYTSVENCASCHTENKVDNPNNIFGTMIHSKHIGRSNEVVGNCLACHPEDSELPQADNWREKPTMLGCAPCHSDIDFTNGVGHRVQLDNQQCNLCHNTYYNYEVHRGKVDRKIDDKAQFSYVVRDAKLVTKVDGTYAQISLEGLDMNGETVLVPAAELSYLWCAEFYVNWGVSADFTTDRSMTVAAMSAKGLNNTPVINDAEGRTTGIFTYEVGPIATVDPISGADLINDIGFISNRVGTCINADGSYGDCSDPNYDWGYWNATWNWQVWFDKDGMVEDPQGERPEQARPVIVSNEKCGVCHGYNEELKMTELNCRGCHPAAKEVFGTTCVSGNNGGEQEIATKALTPRSKNIGPSTADIVDGCTACHNANLPPTQVIRNAQTTKGDADYLEQLVLSHPDHKVWMHSMHASNRANQGGEDWIRNVDYPTSLSNCVKCHEGDTFGMENLVDRKPLALDFDYGDSYYGLDEADWPAGSDLDYRGETVSMRRFAMDAQADMWVSPGAAVCFSCHGKRPAKDGEDRKQVRKEVRAHMEQNGATFDWTGDPALIPVESCAVCHDIDNVKEVHGLQ